MKSVALLALTLPFGPPPSAAGPPPVDWRETTVAGLTLLVGPAEPGVGLSGLTATMPVRAAGGEGTIVARQGLSRDITVTVRDADAAQVAAAFDLPAWLRPRLVGRIGEVRIVVAGDTFELRATKFRIPGDPVARVEASGNTKDRTVRVKAYAFGGLLEYEGRLQRD